MKIEPNRCFFGDAAELATVLPDDSVHCIITSPPYWSLRSHLPEGSPLKPLEIGCENSPSEYFKRLVVIFRELRRALRPDGTFFLNVGDCYAGGDSRRPAKTRRSNKPFRKGHHVPPDGLKPKDLVGLPWMLAFALRNDGWFLCSEIIWNKSRAKPSAVRDRPTLTHEHLFLFARASRYYYDIDAVRQPLIRPQSAMHTRKLYSISGGRGETGASGNGSRTRVIRSNPAGRNRSTVWTLPSVNDPGPSVGAFPAGLAEPCVLAGCPTRWHRAGPICRNRDDARGFGSLRTTLHRV